METLSDSVLAALTASLPGGAAAELLLWNKPILNGAEGAREERDDSDVAAGGDDLRRGRRRRRALVRRTVAAVAMENSQIGRAHV